VAQTNLAYVTVNLLYVLLRFMYVNVCIRQLLYNIFVKFLFYLLFSILCSALPMFTSQVATYTKISVPEK